MTTAERIEAAKRHIQDIDDAQRAWLAERLADRRQWTSEDFDHWERNRAERGAAGEELRQAMEAAFEVVKVKRPLWATDGVYRGKWVVTVVESDGVTVRPRDRLFATKGEADACYEEMKVARTESRNSV
jgi:hypothetical protein